VWRPCRTRQVRFRAWRVGAVGYPAGTVAYRATLSGDTMFAVATNPDPDDQTAAGSTTEVTIWTRH